MPTSIRIGRRAKPKKLEGSETLSHDKIKDIMRRWKRNGGKVEIVKRGASTHLFDDRETTSE